MRKKKIKWFEHAKSNLREIRRFIAKDSPKTARDFTKRLRESANRLKMFPESGWIVEEFELPFIKEILFGNYRIIYRYQGRIVEILAIRHGAQRLGWDILEGI